jgi:hypothetical protein
MKSKSPRRSHSAAWAAHFLADQFVPYHNVGVQYTGQNAFELSDLTKDFVLKYLSFKPDPGKFIEAAESATNGHVDWYDPSYWNSSISTNNSTHIVWERQISYPSIGPIGFSPLWTNSQAEPMKYFVSGVQSLTKSDFDHILTDGQQAARDAAQGIYTAWRSTLSAFILKLNTKSSGNSGSFVVSLVVTNADKKYNANSVQAEIILPAGLTITDNTKKLVNSDGKLSMNSKSTELEWEVNGSSTDCAEIKVQVTGKFDDDIPDAAAVLNGYVEATVFPPPVVKITSPSAGSSINQTKVTVTGTISEENCQAWIEVNGTDKIWISEGFNSTTTFSKEVPLKQGVNSLVVKSVNKCKKEGRSSISVTGDFTESAIKVVMSWNTNGTDVDLHLTFRTKY